MPRYQLFSKYDSDDVVELTQNIFFERLTRKHEIIFPKMSEVLEKEIWLALLPISDKILKKTVFSTPAGLFVTLHQYFRMCAGFRATRIIYIDWLENNRETN